MSTHSVNIGDCPIGAGCPTFVIAEAGINHNGSLETAKELIYAAAEAGVNAVKFQTFRTEELLANSNEPAIFNLFKGVELTYDSFRALKETADSAGIVFLSTPFDIKSLDFLVELGIPAIKIASPDITYLPLLRRAGESGLPVILSTGMSDMAEIEGGISTIKEGGGNNIILLHATIAHPAPLGQLNLAAIKTMSKSFPYPVGYSDHTGNLSVISTAVALGARMVETHFTLDKAMEGPDHIHSIDPVGLKDMIRVIRDTESMIGPGDKVCLEIERGTRAVARRVMVANCHIEAGNILREDYISYKRGANGIPPIDSLKVVGKMAKSSIPKETILREEMFR